MQCGCGNFPIVTMCLTALSVPAVFAQTYIFQDLGTLGGGFSFANAVNGRGEVVGWAQNSRGLTEPFYYRNGSMIGLGILGFSQGQAVDLNNRSEILITAPIGSRMRSYLVQGGSVIDLGTLGGLATVANAMNDNGQIVGGSAASNNTFQAFLYSDGKMQALTLSQPGGFTRMANDINNRGDIVGYFSGTAGTQGYVITSGDFKEIPKLPRGSSVAAKINDQGMVLGYGVTDDGFHSFLWDGDGIKEIGTLGGRETFATGINNLGQVVGRSQIEPVGPWHGFLYQDGTMFDLNDVTLDHAGWTILNATAINDLGQIVGLATSQDGLSHAVLLIPVPEPSVITLLGLSLPILVVLGRMRANASRRRFS